ncbi:redoxin domain-containing protein, partial [bacterium]|nr:redoxin domain-containing protein [bacterium]
MKTLSEGDKAPDFGVVNQNNEVMSLQSYRGKKVILYFYPKDSTPGCTAESCNLRDSYSELTTLGFEVIGVSADSVASHQKFISKHDLPFDLLSDTDRKVIKANASKTVIKEIRFGPNTEEHDLNFKTKHALKFLEEGSKVKAFVFFRGRSIVFKEKGEILLLKFAQALEEHGVVE